VGTSRGVDAMSRERDDALDALDGALDGRDAWRLGHDRAVRRDGRRRRARRRGARANRSED